MNLYYGKIGEHVRFRAGDRARDLNELVWKRVENGVPAGPRLRRGDNPQRAEDILARRAVRPVITNVELPPDELIPLPRGGYETSFFGVFLDKGCALFPLTKRSLHRFSGHDAVREIMGRVDGYNADIGKPGEMAGYLGIYDAFNLAAIINRSLAGGARLIVPPEPVIAAFYSVPELVSRCKGVAITVTASYFDNNKEKITYFLGYTHPETGQYYLSRHGFPANSVWNSGVIFQVIPTLERPPYLPR